MTTPSRHSAPFALTAVVPPGLEAVAAAELSALGASEVQPGRLQVSGRCDLATYYRLHLRARLPFRLLRCLARFPCANRDELSAGVQAAADWESWLPPEASLRVEASGATPALPHSHYTALTVKNALVDWQRQRWGERSSVNLHDPDLALHLHLQHDRRTGLSEAVLSLDGGGGASLHRRGYRSAMGAAPLKENLAAGLIALTGWDGTCPLVDPMCGSGTLLIEAAAMALGLPAGVLHGQARAFGFRRWPDFDPALWQRERETCQRPEPRPLPPLLGLERDPEVLEPARSPNDAPSGCGISRTAARSSKSKLPTAACARAASSERPTGEKSALPMRRPSPHPTAWRPRRRYVGRTPLERISRNAS